MCVETADIDCMKCHNKSPCCSLVNAYINSIALLLKKVNGFYKKFRLFVEYFRKEFVARVDFFVCLGYNMDNSVYPPF